MKHPTGTQLNQPCHAMFAVIDYYTLDNDNSCVLCKVGDQYIMASTATGRHAISESSALEKGERGYTRLYIHWNGFIRNNIDKLYPTH